MVTIETGEVQRAGCSWVVTIETGEVQRAGGSWVVTIETGEVQRAGGSWVTWSGAQWDLYGLGRGATKLGPSNWPDRKPRRLRLGRSIVTAASKAKKRAGVVSHMGKALEGGFSFIRGHQWGGRGLVNGRVALRKDDGEVLESFDVDTTLSYVVPHGDYRIVCAKKDVSVSAGDFAQQKHYDDDDRYIRSNFYHGNNASGYGTDYSQVKPLLAGVKDYGEITWDGAKRPHLPANYDNENYWGDHDNTMATEGDGPFINKPDEGNAAGIGKENFIPRHHYTRRKPVEREALPYFTEPWKQEAAGPGYFSPNRIIPTPGMIGSLPTGVMRGRPWQTILLRPQHESTTQGAPNSGRHIGTEDPKDHYFLDLFWMPVVEPWSISTPLATAGKINLNYDIQPFDHIHRSSGIRSTFPSEEMLTIPIASVTEYTAGWGYGKGYNRKYHTGGSLRNKALRSLINAEETLKQFEEKFEDEGELFVTASQICELHLVPRGIGGLRLNPDLDDMREDKGFWTARSRNPKLGLGLVGDNSRERPYGNIYQRITAKSNTYQVHYRAQVIRQSPMSPTSPGQRRSDQEYGIFDPDVDQAAAEYRGSSIIERYIDPNEENLPDYVVNPPTIVGGGATGSRSLDHFYRFRIVSMKRFAP